MMWNWTANKIANILRKDRHAIPTAWLLSPECVIIPKRKKRAVVWLLAQLVTFRQDDYHLTPLVVHNNYVRVQKERIYNHPRRRNLVAEYLQVVDD
jgi:hypothetical protein